mgnify:CR=1
MARCGRCGLWESYPENHPEKKYAGTCLWYGFRLDSGSVYDDRDCGDFIERVPSLSNIQHYNFKVSRDSLGEAYRKARFSFWLSIVAISLSLFGFGLDLLSSFGGI